MNICHASFIYSIGSGMVNMDIVLVKILEEHLRDCVGILGIKQVPVQIMVYFYGRGLSDSGGLYSIFGG